MINSRAPTYTMGSRSKNQPQPPPNGTLAIPCHSNTQLEHDEEPSAAWRVVHSVELLGCIFEFLDSRSLIMAVPLVCRRWASVCRHLVARTLTIGWEGELYMYGRHSGSDGKVRKALHQHVIGLLAMPCSRRAPHRSECQYLRVRFPWLTMCIVLHRACSSSRWLPSWAGTGAVCPWTSAAPAPP